MRRIILSILLLVLIIGTFFLFSFVWSWKLYDEYSKLWDYRRLHPEFLPDTKTISLLNAGHTTTYADILWINMIQYIWDNIGNGKYIDYAYPLLTRITDMHPYFTRAYILWALLSPSVDPEKENYEKNKLITEWAIQLGVKGMEKTCDTKKIDIIRKKDINNNLWNEKDIQNPCHDGMLPYYIAYAESNVWNSQKAEEYYKIASMNSDAPKASQFLSILMRAKSGDLLEAAKKFLFIAIDGYDEYPYLCQNTSLDILKKIENDPSISQSTLEWIQKQEKKIHPPKDTHNPLAASATNCHDSTMRWIKYIYLTYIQERSRPFPDITKWEELVTKKIIPFIPKLEEQTIKWENWTVIRWSGSTWSYKKIFIK